MRTAVWPSTLPALRLHSTSTNSDPRSTVQQLAAQHSVDNSNLNEDPAKKFALLTACEEAFGLQLQHADLNRISTIESAVEYWNERLDAIAEDRQREEEHWHNVSLPNVTILPQGNNEELARWILRQTGELEEADGLMEDAELSESGSAGERHDQAMQ